jgi:methionyl-tRNA formyltransferase
LEIAVVCTDSAHPVFAHLACWCERKRGEHKVTLTTSLDALAGGDLLFLISCSQIVRPELRGRYRHALVVHASDLPKGRGWSPLVWQVLEGRSEIAVTLLEADDPVDSGKIWSKRWLRFEGHELFDEINQALFQAELELMDLAIAHCDVIQAQAQDSEQASWYPRRRPEDSRLDPQQPLASQFDLLRVTDPERYPAYFELRGHRYEITIRKATIQKADRDE